MTGILDRAKTWMTPERAIAMQGLGLGLSQMAYNQPVNLSPAYDALKQRQESMKMQQVMQTPGIMDKFTPQQRAVLASMPEGLATKVIMESVFAPEPEPTRGVVVNGKVVDPTTGRVIYEGEPGDTAPEYGLTPQYGTDENGNLVLLQLAKDGTAKQTAMPEGIALQKGIEKLDLGDSFQWYNTLTGQPIGEPIKKNLYEAAVETASGKAAGEAGVAATSLDSKMEGLDFVVERLGELADKATYTAAGQIADETRKQLGMEPSEGAVARSEYIAMVDNQILPLLRDTFGSQFTEREGQSLKATLGDPNKTPAEKKAVLKAFIEQKRRDVEALKTQAGVPTEPPSAPTPDATVDDDPLGLFK